MNKPLCYGLNRKTKLKILHLNVSYGRGGGGGTEQCIPNLCSLLEARGHENLVIFSNAFSNFPIVPNRKVVQLEGICSGNLPAAKNRVLVAEVLEIAQREKIEVVHFHQTNNPLLVHTLTNFSPSVYFVHNHILTCPSGQRLYKSSWEACPLQPGWACLVNPYLKNCGTRRPVKVGQQLQNCFQMRQEARAFTELLVDSEFMKQTLLQAGFPANRLTVTASVTELPQLTEQELAYPTSDTLPIVLYVGQLTEVKGVEFLIKAARQVRTPCRFIIVGDGYALPTAQKLVTKLDLAKRVEFKGWVLKEELGQYYRQASLLVVPSIYPEPFGLVGAEAMAYARPVIAFRRGGIPDWLQHGKTGFLVEPANISELAAQIDQILTNPALGEQMGKAGRAYLEEKFDPQVHCTTMLTAYKRAIQNFVSFQ